MSFEWKLQYVKWDLNKHFNNGLVSALNNAQMKKVPKNLEILLFALSRILPTETYEIRLGDYAKFMEKQGGGGLDRFAFEHDLPLDKAKKLFIHMTQRGFLKPENRMFYDTLIHDILILFAHDVYPSLIFGDDVVGALAIDSWEPKEIKNYRLFGKWYDKLELSTLIFYNLPMNGNVWSFSLRKVNPPYRDIGFCYSFEKSGNHHFITPNELKVALNNIIDIRNLWIKDINNFYDHFLKEHKSDYT